MNVASQERRTTVVSSGVHPEPEASTKKKLDRSPYPFAQQVDLVVSGSTYEEIASLIGSYRSCRSTLTDFIAYAKVHVSEYDMKSEIVAVSGEDTRSTAAFSLDPRGILSIVVDKPTYERLGLVGTRMRWKVCAEMYLIQCALTRDVPDESATRKVHRYGPKQESALAAWDDEREPWHIFYYAGPDTAPYRVAATHEVKPHVSLLTDVYVPEPVLRPLPASEEDREDWDEEYLELFEWVGMACLGSQRLLANDRCDPYLAAYTPPCTSRLSTITHVRWCGLSSSEFTQRIVDTVIKSMAPGRTFAAVSIQGVPTAPVAYVPPSSPFSTRMRLPHADSEDTWTLLASNHGVPPESGFVCRWVLAESIGMWDSRWG